MSDDNKSKFMSSSDSYITNLNRVLKNIKSDIMADFVRLDQHGIIITTNKVASALDLCTIKNTDNINSEDISVIAQGCGQTLGLGLGQSKDIVVVFY